MTIFEKIEDLKSELQESGSEQYKAAIRSQLERLEYYAVHGSWPRSN